MDRKPKTVNLSTIKVTHLILSVLGILIVPIVTGLGSYYSSMAAIKEDISQKNETVNAKIDTKITAVETKISKVELDAAKVELDAERRFAKTSDIKQINVKLDKLTTEVSKMSGYLRRSMRSR